MEIVKATPIAGFVWGEFIATDKVHHRCCNLQI
jgi:hypothetical protein